MIGCGDKAESHPVDLSFEEATERAFDAVQRPGMVFHASMTLQGYGKSDTFEIWVDAEKQLAREDDPDGVWKIHKEGCTASARHGTNAIGGSYQPDSQDPFLAKVLNYLLALEKTDEVLEREVVGVSIDGRDLLRLRIKVDHRGEWENKNTTDLYLDEAFLPLRMEYRTTLEIVPGTLRTVYTTEFVPRSSLAEDFFSIAHLAEEDQSRYMGGCTITE
jgi:hypothetical protein